MADERFPITPPAETHDFVRRVLRWLAVVCVAVGALRAVSFIVQLTSYRWWWPSFYYSAGLEKLGARLKLPQGSVQQLLFFDDCGLLAWANRFSWTPTWLSLSPLFRFCLHCL